MISRRNLLTFSAASLASLPLSAFATPTAPVEGKEYTMVRPVVPMKGKKIEVVYFFSYTCPHCFRFDPIIEPWSKKLPSWIDFKLNPVAWDSRLDPFVKTYYALESLGLLPKLHMKFFESVIYQTHKDENPAADIADFMVKAGVNAKQWNSAYNSFGVANKTRAASRLWQSYGIDATPMIGIDGKYVTGPHMTPTRESDLVVVETLAQRARKARL